MTPALARRSRAGTRRTPRGTRGQPTGRERRPHAARTASARNPKRPGFAGRPSPSPSPGGACPPAFRNARSPRNVLCKRLGGGPGCANDSGSAFPAGRSEGRRAAEACSPLGRMAGDARRCARPRPSWPRPWDGPAGGRAVEMSPRASASGGVGRATPRLEREAGRRLRPAKPRAREWALQPERTGLHEEGRGRDATPRLYQHRRGGRLTGGPALRGRRSRDETPRRRRSGVETHGTRRNPPAAHRRAHSGGDRGDRLSERAGRRRHHLFEIDELARDAPPARLGALPKLADFPPHGRRLRPASRRSPRRDVANPRASRRAARRTRLRYPRPPIPAPGRTICPSPG